MQTDLRERLTDIQKKIASFDAAWEKALTKLFRDNIYEVMGAFPEVEEVRFSAVSEIVSNEEETPSKIIYHDIIVKGKDGSDLIPQEQIIAFLSSFPDQWYHKKFGLNFQILINKKGTLEVIKIRE